MKNRNLLILTYLTGLVFISACSSSDTVADESVQRENKKPVVENIEDSSCAGESYQITFSDGEILQYCLPPNAKSAKDFITAYNQSANETNTKQFEIPNPNVLYGSAMDVYDNIAIKFNDYPMKDKVHYAFVFAEFISDKHREAQLREVIYNTVKAYDTNLTADEVNQLTDRALSEGITPRTSINFEYKTNSYLMEIDDMSAIGFSIRTNEFDPPKEVSNK